MLYSPHTLWRFNSKLVDQIIAKKQIICSKIITMHHDGPSQMPSQPIKVTIEALYLGSQTLDPQIMFESGQNINGNTHNPDGSSSSMLYYHSLMKDSISIRMSASRQKQPSGGSMAPIISQEFSLLDLQSTMFLFESIQ